MKHGPSCFCDECRGETAEFINEMSEEENDRIERMCNFISVMVFRDITSLTTRIREYQQGEENNMAFPKPSNTSQPGQGKKANVQFLKVAHLGGKKRHVKVLSFDTTPTNYSDVQLKVDVEGVRYLMGLRLNSNNYKELFSRYGEDEKAWEKAEFDVEPEYNETFEQDNLVISPVQSAPARRSTR